LSRACLLKRGLAPFCVRQLSEVAEPKKKGVAATMLGEKSGTTGAAVLGVGLAGAAMSKEIIVLDADILAGTFLAGATYAIVKNAGPSVVEALDNRAKGIHDTMSAGKNMQIEAFETAIAEEKEAAASLAVAGEIFDMKRELAAIEVEAEYRRRIKMVHSEVKKRLDYQVELENTKKAFIRDHIVNWLEAKVIESITPEQEEANINQCIAKLATLS